MPMPTTSPGAMSSRTTGSSVSSTRWGSPHLVPVAEASTYSHRGVMTATPKDRLLGLMRCTRPGTHNRLSLGSCSIILVSYINTLRFHLRRGRGGSDGTPITTDDQQTAARAGAHREAQR